MPIKIERISEDKCQLGESPFWDQKSQSLYYVDIFGKSVHRYTPSTNTCVKATVGDKNVSFILPVQGQENTFLIGFGNEIAKLKWDGVSDQIQGLETIVELKNTEERRHRWNDGKADPSGRLWAGVFIQRDGVAQIPDAGALYALKSDKTLQELASGVSLSNGLTWNEKTNKFYFIDTNKDEIYEFNYADSKISNRQVIFRLKDRDIGGGPDGMTIDSDGNLWIACFGSSKIVKIDPRKPNTLLQTIDMPVSQVTCVEFAGPNYEDLYVTTAGIARGDVKPPEGGWTYKISGLGVKGVPAREVKL